MATSTISRARLSAVLSRRAGRIAAVRSCSTSLTLAPIHRDVGHERVHRRRVHPRPSAPAGQSALRAHRPRVLDPADRAPASPCASTSSRRICSAVSAGMWFLITERVLVELVPAALAAHPRRRARGADRRDGVHGLEPVGRQREGVHGLARRHRDHLVAHGPLVRRSRRPQGRSHPRARRVSARTRLREPHGRHARRAGRRARGARFVRPRTLLRWKLLARVRRRARASASRRSRRSRSAPRTSRRSTKASRPRAARSSRSRCTFSQGDVRRVHVQLQSRPVRQARSDRAPGAVRGAARHVVAVLQVAVAARRARRASVRCRRCSPRCSSCSGCSAAGCTGSATDEASGTSVR